MSQERRCDPLGTPVRRLGAAATDALLLLLRHLPLALLLVLLDDCEGGV